MEDKKNNGWVQIVLYSLLIIVVFSYFAIGHFFDLPFFGGSKYLVVEDNHIELSINKNFSSLDLFFTKPVLLGKKHTIYIQKKGGGKKLVDSSKYKISSSSDNKVIYIKLTDEFDTTLFIDIEYLGVIKGGFAKKRYIKAIDIDKKDVSLSKFYNTYIDTDTTNLSYFKSLDLNNISNFLAVNYGAWIFLIDEYILISVFAIQLFLLFVINVYSIFTQRSVKIGDDAIFIIKYIDIMAKNYAVILGFFGTVVSIWTALEVAETDYSNFLQILGIVRIAVFTTVLGIATRITYEIREFFYKLT